MIRRRNVRCATPADTVSLGAFLRAAWADAGPGALGFAGATDEVIADLSEPETLRAIVADSRVQVWIAVSHDSIVGFAATRLLDDSTAELSGIIVGERHIGSGIGKDLATTALASVAATGRSTAIVHTEPYNERAIGFYERLGFVRNQIVSEEVGGATFEVLEMTAVLSGNGITAGGGSDG